MNMARLYHVVPVLTEVAKHPPTSSVAPQGFSRNFMFFKVGGLSQLCFGNAVRFKAMVKIKKRDKITGRNMGPRPVLIMSSGSAAASYASALAGFAKTHGLIDQVNNDVQNFSEFLENRETQAFFANPVIHSEKKKEILRRVANDFKFQAYTLNFLCLLVDRKRMNMVADIIKEFEYLYCEMTDTEIVVVTSAIKIENRQLSLIAKKIQSLNGFKNVIIKNIIDSSLVAGFTVNFGKGGSSFIDLSVKGQLDQIAAQIDQSIRQC